MSNRYRTKRLEVEMLESPCHEWDTCEGECGKPLPVRNGMKEGVYILVGAVVVSIVCPDCAKNLLSD